MVLATACRKKDGRPAAAQMSGWMLFCGQVGVVFVLDTVVAVTLGAACREPWYCCPVVGLGGAACREPWWCYSS